MLLAPVEPRAWCETCRLRCCRPAAARAPPGGAAPPGTPAAQDSAVPTGWGRAPRVGAGSLCVSVWVCACSLPARRGAAAPPAGSAGRPLRVLAPSVRAGTAAPLGRSRLRWAAGEVRPAPGGCAPRPQGKAAPAPAKG